MPHLHHPLLESTIFFTATVRETAVYAHSELAQIIEIRPTTFHLQI